MKVLCMLLLFCTALHADMPWGVDAEMAAAFHEKKIFIEEKEKQNKLSPFASFLQRIIRFHQTVLSPVDGPRSHFYPCSSQYMYNAIKKYGALEGFIRGCDRLLRENDDVWVYPLIDRNGEVVKYDPVE